MNEFLHSLRGEVIGRDSIQIQMNGQTEEFKVDTCFTKDLCAYETAILTPKETIVVKSYQSRKLAQEGHKKWCEFLSTQSLSTILNVVRECEEDRFNQWLIEMLD